MRRKYASVDEIPRNPDGTLKYRLMGADGNPATCQFGHFWTPENTGRNFRGHRMCLTCKEAKHLAEMAGHKWPNPVLDKIRARRARRIAALEAAEGAGDV